MVATDRSKTANNAVGWATTLAAAHQADLILLQVLPDSPANGVTPESAEAELKQDATAIAGSRGQARVVVAADLAQAIIDAAEAEKADVLVVGNVGMSGRKQFLLSNIPNRISHNARCSVVIVNTAPADGAAAPARPRRDSNGETGPREGELFGRARKIGWTLAHAGLGAMRSRSNGSGEDGVRRAAQQFRGALDQLGPTFAKLGQILSTRPDLLPPVFIDELATLQERVTPLTEAEVVAVMEQELGVPWEDVFASIDPKPLAAGTIAQVHRATLETGDRVVVKVQRPNAEADILQDLALLELFVEKAANRPAFRRAVDLPAVIGHLSTSLRKELDFRNEGANLKRMREVLAPFPRLAVPALYEDVSTKRLLVMEEIQGVPVREAPPGPARQEAARQLLEAFYHQFMIAGFFHADPHPGNMKWWNEKIYLIDLGMAGEVDSQVRQLVVLLMLAFTQQDADFLAEVVLALSGGEGPTPGMNLDAFRADLKDLIHRYRSRSLSEIQLGPLFQEVSQISVKHRVRVPASLTLMGKSFAQMQLVVAELDPTLDPFGVAQSFVMRTTIRKLSDSFDPKQVYFEAQKARLRLTRMIEGLEGALGARPGASLKVQFNGTDRLEAAIDQGSRRLAYAFGMCGAFALTALVANRSGTPRWLPAVMGGIGTALAANLLRDQPRKA
jgi:predicted unusual protein kinase regulating ubiquinone biosynthesis (AarF/ABC1/UbiB family)/nucleotide-binding universal stress UspA family protein